MNVIRRFLGAQLVCIFFFASVLLPAVIVIIQQSNCVRVTIQFQRERYIRKTQSSKKTTKALYFFYESFDVSSRIIISCNIQQCLIVNDLLSFIVCFGFRSSSKNK